MAPRPVLISLKSCGFFRSPFPATVSLGVVKLLDGQISIGEYLSAGLPAVIVAADTVTAFVAKAWDLMSSNPLIAVFLASGLVSLGLKKFLLMRRAAH